MSRSTAGSGSASATRLVVSCEHGGNRIPRPYRDLFRGCDSMLASHRGYDAGAATLAAEMARTFGAPAFIATVSRLLIDLNRSVGRAQLYSSAVPSQPRALREEILKDYYWPYRTRVETHVAEVIERGGRVIHVSSHSFTPELNGHVRTADIGLLYDPSRLSEAALCERWKQALAVHLPQLRVRFNYPYKGKSDGLASHLRRRFAMPQYIGIELEMNQKHVLQVGMHWRRVRRGVIESLVETLAENDERAKTKRGTSRATLVF